MMVSKLEQRVSGSLRAILAELSIGNSFAESESKQVLEFLSGLDWFLAEILGEIHPEWLEAKGLNADGTDGIVPLVARKTGAREAELFGICYLLTNECRRTETTPIHVRLQVAPVEDEISWLELRLGERDQDGRARCLYDSVSVFPKRFYLLDGNYDRIEWFYKVAYGERSGE